MVYVYDEVFDHIVSGNMAHKKPTSLQNTRKGTCPFFQNM
ncbi:Hypothetical protein I595_1418 [Croceitalea dokdonensis DOKDO 023]|uniref:Uncharacterized protein n=1 Tax=Croceitalea dokdonensis DOKDO 023 TaxID=1300341 RepID=A0A0P7B3D3_9FLAO|nr:Hypothetical protein I595_1418 [Croceitalea dokdonensis DOKDO 023]